MTVAVAVALLPAVLSATGAPPGALSPSPARPAPSNAETQSRVSADLAAGRPIVVHVIVALCDNEHQGIVKVPESLGRGRDPALNLYWGARYGVRTYLTRQGGWENRLPSSHSHARILERVVLHDLVERGGTRVPVYIVADAWDGAEIKGAIVRFLEMAAGRASEEVLTGREADSVRLRAGGGAHLVAFVGHDGLMDFAVEPAVADRSAAPRSAMVLACASSQYFLPHLRRAGAHPLLLTTGLMAPEAYTLDAAIRAWAAGAGVPDVRAAAAGAYDRYQHCGAGAARALFTGEP